jgi:hypothetical protein
MAEQGDNQKQVEHPSLGTKISEKERAKANGFSEQKRQRLFNRGMALIYGGSKHAKAEVSSR